MVSLESQSQTSEPFRHYLDLRLFCGCGGASEGAKQAGYEVVLAVDSWCEALRGRSLLFVGDSLSLQMFWSLLHLVPADRGELDRARRL